MKFTLAAGSLSVLLALGACSSVPPAPPALVEARAAVRTAESDPDVLALAPLELRKATETLNRANVMQAKGESLAEVSSAAHVAQQQARTALAMASAARNEASIQGAEADRERARAEVRTRQAQRAQMEARAAQEQAAMAQGRASTAEQQAAAAQAQAAQAQSAASVAQAKASMAEAESAALQKQLAELQAQQTDRGTLVTLGDLLFEFNRAEVKPVAQGELQKLADFLKAYPDRRVLIEGHTDNVGSDGYNEQLSRRRAEAVAMALQRLGVAAPRVTVIGYGKQYPVADNASATNRALNRRVEVYLSNNDQPVRPRG